MHHRLRNTGVALPPTTNAELEEHTAEAERLAGDCPLKDLRATALLPAARVAEVDEAHATMWDPTGAP